MSTFKASMVSQLHHSSLVRQRTLVKHFVATAGTCTASSCSAFPFLFLPLLVLLPLLFLRSALSFVVAIGDLVTMHRGPWCNFRICGASEWHASTVGCFACHMIIAQKINTEHNDIEYITCGLSYHQTAQLDTHRAIDGSGVWACAHTSTRYACSDLLFRCTEILRKYFDLTMGTSRVSTSTIIARLTRPPGNGAMKTVRRVLRRH
jgi:hypothetical protein